MQNNRLTSLDISKNRNLEEIWVHDNKIESLNCTNNPNLSYIIVWNNNLSYLNIKGTYMGGCPARIYTKGNSRLSEIKVSNVSNIMGRISFCELCYQIDSWTKYVE
jgi:Leucine-rich repeat (LRR) protein